MTASGILQAAVVVISIIAMRLIAVWPRNPDGSFASLEDFLRMAEQRRMRQPPLFNEDVFWSIVFLIFLTFALALSSH